MVAHIKSVGEPFNSKQEDPTHQRSTHQRSEYESVFTKRAVALALGIGHVHIFPCGVLDINLSLHLLLDQTLGLEYTALAQRGQERLSGGLLQGPPDDLQSFMAPC